MSVCFSSSVFCIKMKLFTGFTVPSIFHPSRVLAFNACVLETPLTDGAKALQLEAARRVVAIVKNFIVYSTGLT